MPSILVILIALAITAIAAAGAFVVGMRTHAPIVLRPLVWFSRRFMNPRQLQSAGSPGAYAGVIHHRGRVSGRELATPVGIVAVDGGFLVALPYGSNTQWLRNVMAAGAARIDHEGMTYDVDGPEIIAMEPVARHFSAADQRLFRILDVADCLRLRRVVEPAARETVRAAA